MHKVFNPELVRIAQNPAEFFIGVNTCARFYRIIGNVARSL